jgi:2-desacetyl-2-hydroxyethyl bacteriochlorophyllide A dehydrogenase
MRAVVVAGPGALEVRTVAVPHDSDKALVRIEQAGICGTDVKILSGDIPVDYPRVMGHEMVGEVVRSATGGTIPVGTRVLINPGVYCGHCDLCRRDLRHICRNGGLLGRDVDGVFAEQVAIDEQFLHTIPDSVSRDAAAVLQVLGTVVHAQRAVSVFPDTIAVVVGLGVSGLLQLQMLVARGVDVIGITRSQWKLDLAQEFGAMATATPDAAADLVAEATAGRGADLVVESVGTERTVSQSIELAGHGGDVLIFGTATKGSEGLPYYQLYLKELTLYNPRAAGSGDYDTGIALTAAGRLRLEPLVTARYPIDDAAAAFAAIGGGNLKVVLDVPAS